MKLSVLDRILLAILLIVAIVFSFALFGMSLNIIRLDAVTGFISLFYEYTQNALILAGSGAVLLLICVKLLFAGRNKKHSSAEPAAPASTPRNRRSSPAAATSVVPEPKQRSATRSPGLEDASRIRSRRASGFWVA